MANLQTIENKVSAVRKYLGILENYKKYSAEEIEKDLTLRGAVERYLYLAVQAAIDLAEAMVAFRKLRKPTTMSESFAILQKEKIIALELAEKLTKMVGFRNVIIHDYGKVDYDIVHDVLQQKLDDIEEFLKCIEVSL